MSDTDTDTPREKRAIVDEAELLGEQDEEDDADE